MVATIFGMEQTWLGKNRPEHIFLSTLHCSNSSTHFFPLFRVYWHPGAQLPVNTAGGSPSYTQVTIETNGARFCALWGLGCTLECWRSCGVRNLAHKPLSLGKMMVLHQFCIFLGETGWFWKLRCCSTRLLWLIVPSSRVCVQKTCLNMYIAFPITTKNTKIKNRVRVFFLHTTSAGGRY